MKFAKLGKKCFDLGELCIHYYIHEGSKKSSNFKGIFVRNDSTSAPNVIRW